MDQPVALVTGANRGIGKEIALGLAQAGFHVVLGVRGLKSGEAVLKRLLDQGCSAELLVLNVAFPESVMSATAAFGARHQRLDVLVNNAGVMSNMSDTLLSASEAEILEIYNVNTLGPLRVTRAFLPYLTHACGARVINVSSRGGQLASILDPVNPLSAFEAGAYRLSKHGLNGVTALLSKALQDKGISVNAMCPGWVRTEMGGPDAPLSPEQGADTAVWLATAPNIGSIGGFFGERRAIAW